MAQMEMFPALANSPATELAAAITNTATTISVLDASKLPDAPNIATIGVDESAETVKYTGKSGNDLTGVTRGFSGTAAKAWAVGVGVARYFTAYDADALRGNVADVTAHLADVVNYNGASYLAHLGIAENQDISDIIIAQLALAPVVKVVIPSGVFKITKRIVVPIGKQIVMQGTDALTKGMYAPDSYFENDNYTIIDAELTAGVLFELRKYSMISGGYIRFHNCTDSTAFLIDAGNFECYQASVLNMRVSSTLYKNNTCVKFSLDNTTSAPATGSMENNFDLLITGFDYGYYFKRATTTLDILTLPIFTDFIINGYISGCIQSFKWDCVRGYNGDGSVVNARVQAATLTSTYRSRPHIEMRYINNVQFKTPVWDLSSTNSNTYGILFDNAHGNVFHYFYKSSHATVTGNQADNIFLMDANTPNLIPAKAIDGIQVIGNQHDLLKGNRGLYTARCKYTFSSLVPDFVDINALDYSNMNGYGVKDPATAETFKITGLNYLFDKRGFTLNDLNRECVVNSDSGTELNLRVDFVNPVLVSQIGVSFNDIFLPDNLKIIVTTHNGTVITKMDRNFTLLGINAGTNNIVYRGDLNIPVKSINFVMTGLCTSGGTQVRDAFRIQNIWVAGNTISEDSVIKNYLYDNDGMNVYRMSLGALTGLLPAPAYAINLTAMSSLPADFVKSSSNSSLDSITFDDGMILNRLIDSNETSRITFNHSLNTTATRYLILCEVAYLGKRVSAFLNCQNKYSTFSNISGYEKGGVIVASIKDIGSAVFPVFHFDGGGTTVTSGPLIKIKRFFVYNISDAKYNNLDLYRLQNGFNSGLNY